MQYLCRFVTKRRDAKWLRGRLLLLVCIVAASSLVPTPTGAASFFGSAKFMQQYQMGEATLTNFWGPLATAHDPQTEPYTEGQAGAVCRPMQPCPRFIAVGKRTVQYFDKARMEQNTSGAPVTNGLLAVELISGRVQIGNATYDQRQPATIAAVGDLSNTFPTYADFAKWQAPPTSRDNPVVTLAQADGTTSTYTGAMSDPLTKVGTIDTDGQHPVPLAFSQFRETVGLSTVGLAITEPFWVQVNVAGMPRTVLTQAFERRVLTYTADNPAPYKVEFGNIGAHYYQWRYASTLPMVSP